MTRTLHRTTTVPWACFILVLSTLVGCSKSTDNPVGAFVAPGSQVHLAMSFSRTASGISLGKTNGTTLADSIRIDSITVVVAKIHLHSTADSGAVGDEDGGRWHGGDDLIAGDGHGHSSDSNDVTLNGPFIVHIRDTLSVNFANQTIPPGTYNDISFFIHRVQHGEEDYDSDDQRPVMIGGSDSSIIGSSVVIWGAVMKNGSWTPFTFRSDLELKVSIPGTFTVPQAISSATLAFNFNVSMLFRDPGTGMYLDPTDTSMMNHERIDAAIRAALGNGHCGNDDRAWHGRW